MVPPSNSPTPPPPGNYCTVPNFYCIVERKVADAYGRFGEQTLLENIYGNELVSFHLLLLQTIVKNDFDTIENIIMGGDFNFPLNPQLAKEVENFSQDNL